MLVEVGLSILGCGVIMTALLSIALAIIHPTLSLVSNR